MATYVSYNAAITHLTAFMDWRIDAVVRGQARYTVGNNEGVTFGQLFDALMNGTFQGWNRFRECDQSGKVISSDRNEKLADLFKRLGRKYNGKVRISRVEIEMVGVIALVGDEWEEFE